MEVAVILTFVLQPLLSGVRAVKLEFRTRIVSFIVVLLLML